MIACSIYYMAGGEIRVQLGKNWFVFDTREEFEKWRDGLGLNLDKTAATILK